MVGREIFMEHSVSFICRQKQYSRYLLAPVALHWAPAYGAEGPLPILACALPSTMAQHGLLPCQMDSYLQTLRTTVLRRVACCPACSAKPAHLCQILNILRLQQLQTLQAAGRA